MNNINLTTLITQLPYLSDVAHAQVSHPEAQQAFAAQMAQQGLKDQNEQVQKVQPDQESGAISEKDPRRRGKKRQELLARRRAQEPEEEPVQASNASAWVGHLLDRKV